MPHLAPVALLVEDEFLLRLDAADMIEQAGFEVIQAGNADEAIAILEARSDIHVVFTDVQMPGSMDGLKLVNFVRDRWPPIKILATCGFVRVGPDDLPAGSAFLAKPYQAPEVVATLHKLTGHGPTAAVTKPIPKLELTASLAEWPAFLASDEGK